MQALANLSSDINELKAELQRLNRSAAQKFEAKWMDGQDVMFALKVSKRTLQTMRDTGILPYSRINGKFYYKVSDLEELLQKNYSRNTLNR